MTGVDPPVFRRLPVPPHAPGGRPTENEENSSKYVKTFDRILEKTSLPLIPDPFLDSVTTDVLRVSLQKKTFVSGPRHRSRGSGEGQGHRPGLRPGGRSRRKRFVGWKTGVQGSPLEGEERTGYTRLGDRESVGTGRCTPTHAEQEPGSTGRTGGIGARVRPFR